MSWGVLPTGSVGVGLSARRDLLRPPGETQGAERTGRGRKASVGPAILLPCRKCPLGRAVLSASRLLGGLGGSSLERAGACVGGGMACRRARPGTKREEGTRG